MKAVKAIKIGLLFMSLKFELHPERANSSLGSANGWG
jgi:hypothetical protein